MRHRRKIAAVGLAVLLSAGARAAESGASDINGKARVIDADTIEVGGSRLQLYGIDAPGENEACQKDAGQWNCGRQASWALAFILAEHWVNCRPQQIGFTSQSQAASAICTIGPGQDIAETMLRQGWARAAPSSPPGYASAEVAARQARVGLWQ